MTISAVLLNLPVVPHFDENQIIRSLSHRSRQEYIRRSDYEPQGWPAPAIQINTREAYDRIMAQFPKWIPMHGLLKYCSLL